MTVYRLNPLNDPRWPEFIQRHPQSSVFHTPAWLHALSRTYRYEPVVYTTTKPGQDLTNGIPFCLVRSWLTGKRLVSLPFSDHCEILLEHPEQLEEILLSLRKDLDDKRWKYVELRPLRGHEMLRQAANGFIESHEFYFHELNLRPDINEIFSGFHKTSISHKIRRAERENFLYEKGRSEDLLRKFYYLQIKTRRKHQIPPQPLIWFRNLIEQFPESLDIHVVSNDRQPIASIITVPYKDCSFWKYSCSDPELDKLGITRTLIWKSICGAKAKGACTFDMGRSELENSGLVIFKDRWGALRSNIKYYRCPVSAGANPQRAWMMRIAKSVFRRAPDIVLPTAGRILYRHMA
jgi:hypothetical protein